MITDKPNEIQSFVLALQSMETLHITSDILTERISDSTVIFKDILIAQAKLLKETTEKNSEIKNNYNDFIERYVEVNNVINNNAKYMYQTKIELFDETEKFKKELVTNINDIKIKFIENINSTISKINLIKMQNDLTEIFENDLKNLLDTRIKEFKTQISTVNNVEKNLNYAIEKINITAVNVREKENEINNSLNKNLNENNKKLDENFNTLNQKLENNIQVLNNNIDDIKRYKYVKTKLFISHFTMLFVGIIFGITYLLKDSYILLATNFENKSNIIKQNFELNTSIIKKNFEFKLEKIEKEYTNKKDELEKKYKDANQVEKLIRGNVMYLKKFANSDRFDIFLIKKENIQESGETTASQLWFTFKKQTVD